MKSSPRVCAMDYEYPSGLSEPNRISIDYLCILPNLFCEARRGDQKSNQNPDLSRDCAWTDGIVLVHREFLFRRSQNTGKIDIYPPS